MRIQKNACRIIFRGHKVWLCKNSIVVYFPKGKSYFTGTADQSKSLAMYDIKQLIIGLENLLKVSFKINNSYILKVSKQHYGHIKNSLAKQYNKEGKRLKVFNKDGLWFVIDNSLNLHEAETLHPETAQKDMDNAILPFFNSLKEEPFTAYNFKDMYKTVREMTLGYAENIKLHLSAIQDIRDTLKDIKKIAKK